MCDDSFMGSTFSVIGDVWRFDAPCSGSHLHIRKRKCICLNASLMIVYFFLSGEGMAAIPVIKHCVQQQPGLTILMTTTTFTAL